MQLGGVIPGAQFVDPSVLARIGNLELVARSVVDGVINGLHKSPAYGTSVDFAEHRGYVPGDDIRRVDWRVFARTDKYYVKEFEADSNMNFVALLDVSASMDYGPRLTKLDYAKTLAACLTYLVHRQRDRVGLVTFDHEIVDHVPPSAKHLDVVLHTLDRAKATRQGQLSTPLRRLAEHFGRRGAIVLISDLYDSPRPSSTPWRRCASAATTSSSSTCSTRPSSSSRSPTPPRSRIWKPASSCRWCPSRSARSTRR